MRSYQTPLRAKSVRFAESAVFVVLCGLASWALLEKYLGREGLLAMTVLAIPAIWVLGTLLSGQINEPSHPDPSRVLAIALVSLAGLSAALFVLVYPIINVNEPGRGSDRDDALLQAAQALMAGRPIYAEPTYLGNPITPMPGAVILALPFVWLGWVGAQWVFWLVLSLVLVLRRYLGMRGPRRHPGALLAALLGLGAPVVLHDLLTGGDLLSNALYVLLSLAWLRYRVDRYRTGHDGSVLLAAACFGLCLASRMSFWPFIGLAAVYIAARQGWRLMFLVTATVLAVVALVIGPFYLVDPSGFTPLHVLNKAAIGPSGSSAWVMALTATASLLICIMLWLRPEPQQMAWGCVFMLAIPPVAVALTASVAQGALRTEPLSYLVLALPYVVWAFMLVCDDEAVPARREHKG